MNINSNKYTFIYAIVLVAVVAVVLSITATLLQPKQAENAREEKMQNILSAAAEGKKSIVVTKKNAAELYEKYIIEELVVDTSGTVISRYNVQKKNFSSDSQMRAFDLDPKIILENIKKGAPVSFPVFVYQDEIEQRYIIPVRGTGLWGALWGYVALNDDLSTIAGVRFDHKGETPGLGSSITTPQFTSEFIGKKITDEKGEPTKFSIVKGGIQKLPEKARIHAVDAISGATVTSDGVQNMLNSFFGYYKNWILQNNNMQTEVSETNGNKIILPEENSHNVYRHDYINKTEVYHGE